MGKESQRNSQSLLQEVNADAQQRTICSDGKRIHYRYFDGNAGWEREIDRQC